MDPKVICVIMGGGRGTRLYPLTKERCKPAVPLAGRYRLVDIPISNCLNSGFNQIFVLSQFHTASLHRHIQMAYKFDPFGGGFVDILSAEQTEGGSSWYQGTADAVRQNLHHFHSHHDDDLFLILSGDQLYRMDFRKIIRHHLEKKADVTIAATPIADEEVSAFGVMRVLDDYSIAEFVEKPEDPEIVSNLLLSPGLREGLTNIDDAKNYCLASMGIYVFKASVLREALTQDAEQTDFGKEIIPGFLGRKALSSYIFDDYWEDIGTVKAFFEANLMLCDEEPSFDLYGTNERIYSRARHLPPSRVVNTQVGRAIWANGCQIIGSTLDRCVIGVRSLIGNGSKLKNVFMMGSDYYDDEVRQKKAGSTIPVGIGENCVIENAIIDKNARIGNNVTLKPDGKPDKFEAEGVFVRDGVLVVLKNAVIPDGTTIAP